MKINTLKYFIVLAESKSINEAAHKLYISQPSLSKSIQLMEKELGYKLFYRTKQGINLTAAGSHILPDAKKIVKIYDTWIKNNPYPKAPPIKIYGHISFSDFLLPDAVVKIKEHYPEQVVSYRTVSYPDKYISPDSDAISIVMTVCDDVMKKSLSKFQGNLPVVLLKGEYQCLVSKESALAKKKYIYPEDLKDMYLMLPDAVDEFLVEGCFLRPIMSGIIHASKADHVVEVDTLQNVIDTVRNNPRAYAISFYPALVRYQTDKKALVHIPYKNLKTKGSLCLFYSAQAARKYPIVNTIIRIIVNSVSEFSSRVTESNTTN
jgi:DNA-binding transcriptional LysR family regulator